MSQISLGVTPPLIPPFSCTNSPVSTPSKFTLHTLRAPYGTIPDYLNHELSTFGISSFTTKGYKFISAAINPLHQHTILEREVILTEKINLHMILQKDRIYLKPLPTFLLHYDFFMENLCQDPIKHQNACGLLRTYANLIIYQTDLHLAINMHLLPDITWEQWSTFAADIGRIQKEDVSERYKYGECRIYKSNKLFHLMDHSAEITSMTPTPSRKEAELLLFVFAFWSILLSALQTILAGSIAGGSVVPNFTSSVASCGGVTAILMVLSVVTTYSVTAIRQFTIGQIPTWVERVFRIIFCHKSIKGGS